MPPLLQNGMFNPSTPDALMPNEPPAEMDKVADLDKEVMYERRVVAFYDVLGWKSHIKRAAQKVEEIGFLRRLILKTVRAPRLDKGLDIKVSTFSDNVVISQIPGINTPQLLTHLAVWQLGAAINGFLLRGGVTVGDLIHEDELVFGPGLNRAHYLESKIATYPRIALDPLYMKELGELGNLCDTEHSVCFINPFRLAFCQHLKTATHHTSDELTKGGLPKPQGVYAALSSEQILAQVADSLSAQMKEPMTWKEVPSAMW
jgi:hypothetical protein